MGPEGFIPAVFERNNPGHASRILPAIEGVVYPLFWAKLGEKIGQDSLNPKGDFSEMLSALRRHTETLMNDPQNRNRFPDGGIRLSSTSSNSWLSKIALYQHICREHFNLENNDQRQKAADQAHVKWVTEGESAYWAMSDQIVDGVAKGSKYYPRCVTMALWTQREARPSARPTHLRPPASLWAMPWRIIVARPDQNVQSQPDSGYGNRPQCDRDAR